MRSIGKDAWISKAKTPCPPGFFPAAQGAGVAKAKRRSAGSALPSGQAPSADAGGASLAKVVRADTVFPPDPGRRGRAIFLPRRLAVRHPSLPPLRSVIDAAVGQFPVLEIREVEAAGDADILFFPRSGHVESQQDGYSKERNDKKDPFHDAR